jgi:histone H3/H4
MAIRKNSTKTIMKSVTKKPISDSAIIYINNKLEEQIKDITIRAEVILEETNKARELQGLRKRKRLSEIEIREVIG